MTPWRSGACVGCDRPSHALLCPACVTRLGHADIGAERVLRPSGADRDIRIIPFGGSDWHCETLNLPFAGEDAHGVTADFAVVVDGATPVAPGEEDAAAFAARLAEALIENGTAGLSARLRKAISSARRPGVTGERQPTACVAMVEADGDTLHYGLIGDAEIVIRLRDERVMVAPSDEVLRANDADTAERARLLLEEGYGMAETRIILSPHLRAKRALANAPGGYRIIGADPADADHLRTGSVALEDVAAVLLCSDGFARLWEQFHIVRDHAAALRWVERDGLANAGHLLRLLEMLPDAPRDFPALKRHDDVSAILLTRSDAVEAMWGALIEDVERLAA